MRYSPHTLCNRPLRYLIQEGFVIVKMVQTSETKANLVLDMRRVPNLPVKKPELDLLIQDVEFLREYSENIKNEGGESFA